LPLTVFDNYPLPKVVSPVSAWPFFRLGLGGPHSSRCHGWFLLTFNHRFGEASATRRSTSFHSNHKFCNPLTLPSVFFFRVGRLFLSGLEFHICVPSLPFFFVKGRWTYWVLFPGTAPPSSDPSYHVSPGPSRPDPGLSRDGCFPPLRPRSPPRVPDTQIYRAARATDLLFSPVDGAESPVILVFPPPGPQWFNILFPSSPLCCFFALGMVFSTNNFLGVVLRVISVFPSLLPSFYLCAWWRRLGCVFLRTGVGSLCSKPLADWGGPLSFRYVIFIGGCRLFPCPFCAVAVWPSPPFASDLARYFLFFAPEVTLS